TIPTQTAITSHAPSGPLVQVQRLTRVIGAHAQKRTILDDLTFTVPARSLFAINGPSGSGKSTLLNMLTGIDRPTSGRVVFAGEGRPARPEAALPPWGGAHVAIVSQFFQSFHPTPPLPAGENVLLALQLGGRLPRCHWRRRALACLDLAGVA